ncbi:hypothetical protein VOLCADRAFT_101046 [Volvox carteri f. nagariensis]|uniref:Uncharacterized protein n=1 Tax=Volvox carteri f. nagariensis TaxID=3068 RepID=D8ULM1_VOLCA|nr:uncharacterized protein VOLCADRAFT_101046 [Volvox carteri f. nagariensis]EFJ39378.1 hypothetical protein VOLCADRAFT_101046 [Volvox carteri f. nagariensis]|eukprot:XP_002959557.1 hypothetical protein VOLCADRAFT_101046 [Volvox carteri f. nagariensis]
MTSLWETLTVAVMDAALSLHNDAFRQLLPRYRGYECHTVRLWARGRVKEVAEAPGSVVFFPMLVLVLLWRRRHPVVVLRGAEHFTITSFVEHHPIVFFMSRYGTRISDNCTAQRRRFTDIDLPDSFVRARCDLRQLIFLRRLLIGVAQDLPDRPHSTWQRESLRTSHFQLSKTPVRCCVGVKQGPPLSTLIINTVKLTSSSAAETTAHWSCPRPSRSTAFHLATRISAYITFSNLQDPSAMLRRREARTPIVNAYNQRSQAHIVFRCREPGRGLPTGQHVSARRASQASPPPYIAVMASLGEDFQQDNTYRRDEHHRRRHRRTSPSWVRIGLFPFLSSLQQIAVLAVHFPPLPPLRLFTSGIAATAAFFLSSHRYSKLLFLRCISLPCRRYGFSPLALLPPFCFQTYHAQKKDEKGDILAQTTTFVANGRTSSKQENKGVQRYGGSGREIWLSWWKLSVGDMFGWKSPGCAQLIFICLGIT